MNMENKSDLIVKDNYKEIENVLDTQKREFKKDNNTYFENGEWCSKKEEA